MHKGLIAAAVEDPVRTAPGRVVFLTTEGRTLTDVEVSGTTTLFRIDRDKRVGNGAR